MHYIRSTIYISIYSLVFLICFIPISCIPDFSYTIPIDDAYQLNINDINEDINSLLDRYTDTQQIGDSNMTIILSGQPAYDAFYNLIATAQNHINIETFQFDNDSYQPKDTGMEFINLLIAKAKQGVEVNIIIDPLAQTFNSFLTRTQKLKRGGVNVVYYDAPGRKGADINRLYYRTHKKILIVDGKKAIIGGMNYGFLYFGENQWRDTSVLLEGPVVAKVQDDFLRDWQALGRKISQNINNYYPELKKAGEYSIRIIDQRPAQKDFDINTAVLIALRQAKEHIDIEAPYFNPSDWLVDEFRDASARGVKIRILTNSQEGDDVMLSYTNTAYWFEPMISIGVEIYLWDIPHKTMHSKAIVVDDKFAMIGSYNFNIRSIGWDAEQAAIFTDEQAVKTVQEMLNDDFNCSCIFRVTQEWIDAHRIEQNASWNIWHALTSWFM